MGRKSNGLNTGKALKKRRHNSRWCDKDYVKKVLNLQKKADPLEGAFQAKGIVIEILDNI